MEDIINPILQIKDVCISYTSSTMAVKHVTADIERNSITAIMGPSGCGKSTLLRAINRMHELYRNIRVTGEILLNGENVLLMQPMEERRHIGMVFQRPNPFPTMNIYDNVALPLRECSRLTEEEIRRKVLEILVFLELEESMHKMPGEISGGMVKRAGLARAVVCEPKIMLYDEPTSGLDPVMSRKIDGLIDLLKRKFRMTSVVVTHDLVSALNIGDTVAMLYEGRVIECAPPDQFVNSGNPLVREFITAQFHTRKAGDL